MGAMKTTNAPTSIGGSTSRRARLRAVGLGMALVLAATAAACGGSSGGSDGGSGTTAAGGSATSTTSGGGDSGGGSQSAASIERAKVRIVNLFVPASGTPGAVDVLPGITPDKDAKAVATIPFGEAGDYFAPPATSDGRSL